MVSFGRSSLDVGRTGMGCAALGNLYTPITDEVAVAAIDAAWDAGIRLFDTAPLYGHGLSERRVGLGLAHRPREEYVVSTKVGRLLVEPTGPRSETIFADVPAVEPEFDFSADGVQASIEASLGRLGVDRLDLVHVHDPEDHLDTAIDGAFATLVRLRDEGVIAAIGVGTNHADVATHVVERVDIDVVLLAGRYTLLDRSGAQTLFPACDERGIAVLAAGVFNSGILAAPAAADDAHFHYAPASPEIISRVAALRAITDGHGVALAAAALQFPLRHPSVDAVLVGPRDAAEVEVDVAWLAATLPESMWDELSHEIASHGLTAT